MKKLIFTVAALLGTGAIQALPLGNPSDPTLYTRSPCCGWELFNSCNFGCLNNLSVRIGYYGNYVFDRHLEVRGHCECENKDIERSRLFTNAGEFVLNYCNWVEFFATVGATSLDLEVNDRISVFDGCGISPFFFSPDFSWSVGGRIALWECRCLTLGLEGEYFRTTMDFNRFEFEHRCATFSPGKKARYREGQVGIGVAYEIACHCPTIAFIPYAGVKWSWVNVDTKGFLIPFDDCCEICDIRLPHLRNAKTFGYAFGTTLAFCDSASVTGEARFGDEKALYINSEFRF